MIEEVDWFRVIADLKGEGYSIRRISEETGISQNALSLLWRGHVKQPRYMTGRSIEVLWCRVHGRFGAVQLPTK